MHFSYHKLCLAIGVSLLLAGCLTTPDLIHESNGFSPGYHQLINSVAEKAEKFCVTGRYKQSGTKKKFVSKVPISTAMEVRRVYGSKTEWYKFQVVTRSIFGHIYYNKLTQQLKCGDENWQSEKDLAGIVFDQITPDSPEALANPLSFDPTSGTNQAPLKEPAMEPPPTQNQGFNLENTLHRNKV